MWAHEPPKCFPIESQKMSTLSDDKINNQKSGLAIQKRECFPIPRGDSQ